MKAIKIIKKWSALRHPDPTFAKTAIAYYKGLDKKQRSLMIKEFQDYIEAVDNGSIIASPIELPTIPKLKV